MAASTSPCLVRGTIHHGCLFDGVGGGLHVYYIYMVLHLPEDDGNSANTYFYLNSVQNLLTQVPSSIQKPHATWIFQGHMQGQLSTITVTPEEDWPDNWTWRCVAHGAWVWGLSATLQWLSFVYYYVCTNVCDRDIQSGGDLLYIRMTPAPKTRK